MDIVVVGGHGKIAMLLHPLLVAEGDRVRALIRNPDHAADVRKTRAEPVVCDLEAGSADVEAALAGADAVIFAAGAGPGSGPDRKRALDLGGVVRTVDAAKAQGVRRYVVVSSVGADPEAEDDGGFGTYLRAKGEADAYALASGLEVTIVRPGPLVDDPPTGLVEAGEVGRGEIPRADVAAVLSAVVRAGDLAGVTFDVRSGDVPVADAVASLSG